MTDQAPRIVLYTGPPVRRNHQWERDEYSIDPSDIQPTAENPARATIMPLPSSRRHGADRCHVQVYRPDGSLAISYGSRDDPAATATFLNQISIDHAHWTMGVDIVEQDAPPQSLQTGGGGGNQGSPSYEIAGVPSSGQLSQYADTYNNHQEVQGGDEYPQRAPDDGSNQDDVTYQTDNR